MATAEHHRNIQRNAPPTAPTVQTNQKLQLDHYGDGRQVLKDIGAKQVQLQPTVRPGNVIIPGVGETTIEAARAAGLLPPGFSEPAGVQSPIAAPAGNHQGDKQEAKVEQNEAPKGEPDATDAAAKIMDTLSGTIGNDAVVDSLWLAAETGDIEACTPKGVSEADVATMVEGFTMQANAVLKSMPTGAASVDMLMETLTEAELRGARKATITHDKDKLAHFGKLALDRMETLPYRNADAFEALIADMPVDERKALTYNDDRGQWMVSVPGRPPMSFGSAVRAGIVRIG